MRTQDFDPLAYIESAFLDVRAEDGTPEGPAGPLDLTLPSFRAFLESETPPETIPEAAAPKTPKARFRKTAMTAPRPRRATAPPTDPVDPELEAVWRDLPKNVAFLVRFHDDKVTEHYYRDGFKETRAELIRRLLDPEITLEETARLLGVCPATIRRYTNRGWLSHHRTPGGQRRFRLSDVVRFVEAHGRFPQEK